VHELAMTVFSDIGTPFSKFGESRYSPARKFSIHTLCDEKSLTLARMIRQGLSNRDESCKAL
jgi:hypothetical protein